MAKKNPKSAEPTDSGAPAASRHTSHPTDPEHPDKAQAGVEEITLGAAEVSESPAKTQKKAKSAKSKRAAGQADETPGESSAAKPEPAPQAAIDAEAGIPVVSKKSRSRKKLDTDQPELNVAAQISAPAEAAPASGTAGVAPAHTEQVEAAAQARDTFEDAFEERVPAGRRDPLTVDIDPPVPHHLERQSSMEQGQPIEPAATAAASEAIQDVEPEYLESDEEEEEDVDEEDEDLDEEEDEDLDEEDDEEDEEEEDGVDEEEEEDEDGVDEEEEDETGFAERPAPNLQRLQKILSQAGIASRRHAEELITEGRVQVNGQTVTELGSKADPGRDHIRVDGKLLHGAERQRYFVLNKPRGYVTTVSDPEGRPTVMSFFAKQAERLYPVGRLDYLSEGLLLMTNDGDLANKLTRAATGVQKTYLVKVSGQPTEEELDRLRAGVAIDKGKPGEGRVHTSPADVRQVRQGDNPWYEVVLVEGRNRELRKMFEEIGHFVEKIRRVGYGPLVLDQEPGQMRELDPEEVELLRKAADGKLRPKARPKPIVRPETARRDTRPARPADRSSDRSKDRGASGDRAARPFPDRSSSRPSADSRGYKPAGRPAGRREEGGDSRRSAPFNRPGSRPAGQGFGARPGQSGGASRPQSGRGERPGGFTARPPSRESSRPSGDNRPVREGDSGSYGQRRGPGNFASPTARPPQGAGDGRPSFPNRQRPAGQGTDRNRTQPPNRGFSRPPGSEGRTSYRRDEGAAGREQDAGRNSGPRDTGRRWAGKPGTGRSDAGRTGTGAGRTSPGQARGSFGDRPRTGRPGQGSTRPPRTEGRGDFPARNGDASRPANRPYSGGRSTGDGRTAEGRRPAPGDGAQSRPAGPARSGGFSRPSGPARPSGPGGAGRPANRGGAQSRSGNGKPAGGFRSGPKKSPSGSSDRPRSGPPRGGTRGGRPPGRPHSR